MSERVIPLASVDRLIRKASGLRVSEDAALELVGILEEHAIKIGFMASEFAKHAKRKTITGADIKLTVKNLLDQKN